MWLAVRQEGSDNTTAINSDIMNITVIFVSFERFRAPIRLLTIVFIIDESADYFMNNWLFSQ